MFCPECGNDAGEAKFCPECGTQLDQVRAAVKSPRTTGARARKAPRAATADAAPVAVQAPAQQAQGGMKPLYLWLGVLGVAIVAAILVVVFTSDKSSSSSSVGGTVDLSGSYSDLVKRANTMYDTGQQYLQSGDMAKATQYYAKVAQVYQAAWQKQATDPAVGADFATSLFYAGDTQGALAIVNQALKLKPTDDVLQKALMNKGNFLAMAGRVAISKGNDATGQKLLAQAKASYEASIKVAPGTATAKQAQSEITTLSQVTPAAAVSTTP